VARTTSLLNGHRPSVLLFTVFGFDLINLRNHREEKKYVASEFLQHSLMSHNETKIEIKATSVTDNSE